MNLTNPLTGETLNAFDPNQPRDERGRRTVDPAAPTRNVFNPNQLRDKYGRWTESGSSDIAGAVSRGNVEKDGRIWRGGVPGPASIESVESLVAEVMKDQTEREEKLATLKQASLAQPEAPIHVIRSYFYNDSGITSWSQGIKQIEARIRSSDQYIEDLFTAGRYWIKKSSG